MKKQHGQSLVEYKNYQNELNKQELIDIILYMDTSHQLKYINLQKINKNVLITTIKHGIDSNSSNAIEFLYQHCVEK